MPLGVQGGDCLGTGAGATTTNVGKVALICAAPSATKAGRVSDTNLWSWTSNPRNTRCGWCGGCTLDRGQCRWPRRPWCRGGLLLRGRGGRCLHHSSQAILSSVGSSCCSGGGHRGGHANTGLPCCLVLAIALEGPEGTGAVPLRALEGRRARRGHVPGVQVLLHGAALPSVDLDKVAAV